MIGIYYEHPHWFAPLFAELDRRRTPYTRLHAERHRFDPGDPPPYRLVFNRMSPSAWLRGHGHAVFYTHHFLDHLERFGVRVINGTRAFHSETSKAVQLSVLRSLGLPYPPTRIINDAADAPSAAAELRYPVVVKPNVGGSGAGVRRFDAPADLAIAAATGGLELGPDHTALVQEFIPSEAGRITRVEVLGGKFLYAIRVYSSGETYNLCPADVCQTTDGTELVRAACPADAPRNGLRVEGYDPQPEVARQVEQIAAACGIDVGGIEYAIDDRDGRLFYYDVNALSNFVADAPRVVGFDPVARLADYLESEAR
ncbi:MAG: RimK family alpha-L-glutamate ligase [Gemmatimonadales bacterium]